MSSYRDEEINSLISLGLTYVQAKIYLSTLYKGPIAARTISKIADISRPDVYRVLPSLLKMGLLKKQLSFPAMYEAIEPENGIKLLLSKKKNEYSNALRKGNEFVKFFQTHNIKHNSTENDERTVWIVRDDKNPVDPLLMDSLRATKFRLDFTTRYNLFAHAMNSLVLKEWISELYKAVKRGVEIRMVLDKPEVGKLVNELSFKISYSKLLVENPNFKYKYLQSPLECILIVFDNDTCLIETSPAHDVQVCPYLWTSNPVLVNLAKAYFANMWDAASGC